MTPEEKQLAMAFLIGFASNNPESERAQSQIGLYSTAIKIGMSVEELGALTKKIMMLCDEMGLKLGLIFE